MKIYALVHCFTFLIIYICMHMCIAVSSRKLAVNSQWAIERQYHSLYCNNEIILKRKYEVNIKLSNKPM